MKVLFVDDEARVIQGIQRSLYHVENLCCEVASSGAEAVEVLKQDTFDVVVTDMRMPGMDGAQLLAHVQREYPATVRIVLSGYAEEEAALRAVGVAHQFLSKPCSPDELRRTIQQTFDVQSLFQAPELQKLVASLPALPVAPAVYSKLNELLADPDASVLAMSRVIETDPALCAKLLQLVNSSFFANRYPTTEVHAAVVRLGVGTLKTLVLSLEAMEKLKPRRRLACFSHQDEAMHAQSVARLVSSFYDGRQAKAHAFMAGMLHDIGKWVLASGSPDLLVEASRMATSDGMPLQDAERQLFGTTHAEIGAYLLGIWGIPLSVVAAVANHHAPERLGACTSGFDLGAAVHVSDRVCAGRPLESAELHRLGCPEEAPDLVARLGALESAA